MKPTHLDPAKVLADPYSAEYVPLPNSTQLRAMGVFPTKTGGIKLEDDAKSAQISTRIPTAVLYAIDRILERRMLKVSNRAEFFKTAVVNLVFQYAEEIQEGRIKLTVRRLEMMRRAAAEAMLLGDINEMAVLVRRNADLYVAADSDYEAVKALREAKRFMEEIPSSGLQDQFSFKLFGSKDGKGRPEGWEDDPVASLWAKVLDGELDHDTDEEQREKARLA